MPMNCLKSLTGGLFTTEKDGLTTKNSEYLSQMRNFRKDGNHNDNGAKKYDKLGEGIIVGKHDKVESRENQKIREFTDRKK